MSKNNIKNPDVYIWDMLFEIGHIEKFMQRGDLHDEMVGHAVLRAFTVLGEACKRIGDDVKQKNQHIPWQKIIGIRNILSHEYEEINLQRIGKIITDDLPTLKIELLLLYKTLTGDDYYEA
ncbi:MAG: HepT-like ribonuclease domain-containing protein [Pseudomonadota bacterium]